MQDALLHFLYRLARTQAKLVFGIVAVLTLGLAAFIPGLTVSSSRADLFDPAVPENARYNEFMAEFGAADNLVVVLEGDPATLKSAAAYFAREIGQQKDWVKQVFYRIDLDMLQARAPLFVPTKAMEDGLELVKAHGPLIGRINDLTSLKTILSSINGAVAEAQANANPQQAEVAATLFKGMATLFDEWALWIKDPGHNEIALMDKLFTTGTQAGSVLKAGGYLLSHDQRLLFMFVQPSSPSDERDYLKPFMKNIRDAVERVYEANPGLRGKVTVGLTGMPAHALSESDTVFNDVTRAGAASNVLVLLILLVGFRSLKKAILATIPLALGIVMMLGLSVLVVGKLNLVSSAFLAVLFGIGIDFAIYIVRRTEEELGNGATIEKAVEAAVTQSGKGVLTGGLTTGLAFLTLVWTDFSGFAELGLVAGLGVLVTMAVTLVVLPALLLKIGIEPHQYDIKWLVSLSGRAHERGLLWAIATVSILITAWSVYAAQKVGFDYNALHLLPADTESTVYQLKMQEKSDFQVSFAAMTARSLPELKAMVARAEALPTVARVDSLAGIIPDDQARKLQLVAEFRPHLQNVRIVPDRTPVAAADYVAELTKLTEHFESIQEAAFSGGRKDVVEGTELVLKSLAPLKQALAAQDPEFALTRTRAFEQDFFGKATKAVDLLHKWLNCTALTESDLAPELLARFKSPKGTYVAYVFPRESIWDLEFLDVFVKELREIDPAVTGFPVTHRVFTRLAKDGLFQSVVYAFALILALLYWDFRRVGPVLLALVPLVIGMLWTQGALYLIRAQYNFANIAALPLLLGLGVVYGVHMVHRWLETPTVTAFAAADTTGQAVGLSALTTVAGLFSIVFARHVGVATFGTILLIGITMCLVTSVYVLPALIDLFNPQLPDRPAPAPKQDPPTGPGGSSST